MSIKTKFIFTPRVVGLEGVGEVEEACPHAASREAEEVKAKLTSTRSLEAALQSLQSLGLGAVIAVEDLTS